MKKALLLIACFLFFGFLSANEEILIDEETPCWYVKGLGGYNFMDLPVRESFEVDLKDGYFIAGAFGYKFSRSARMEAEIAFRENVYDKFVIHSITDYVEIPISGVFRRMSAMVNYLIDLPLFSLPIHPYVGAGIGVRYDQTEINAPVIIDNELYFAHFSGQEYGPAYQALAGIAFHFFNKTDMRIEYRYLDWPESQPSYSLGLTLKRYF